MNQPRSEPAAPQPGPELVPNRNNSSVLDRLASALHSGVLPAHYNGWAQRLLKRLAAPVQIVVIGPPRSGKSALIDMLLGRSVIGGSPAAGLIEVAYGPKEQAEIHRAPASGTAPIVSQHAGLLADRPPGSGAEATPLRLRQHLPDPRLKDLNLAEISLTGTPQDQAAILDQAVQFADVILWCSRAFGASEQDLWASVPDHRKDNAFLVLSMADQLIMRDRLSATMQALAPVAADEFLGLYPLAAIQGLNAQRQACTAESRAVAPGPGAGLDRSLWHQSGGKRLYDDLMAQIDRGRTNDMDQALALLAQCDQAFTAPPATPAPPPTAPLPQAPQRSLPDPEGTPPVRPSPAQKLPSQDPLSDAAAAISQTARDLLASGDGVDLDQVLQSALDCVRGLTGQLTQCDSRTPEIRAAREAVQEGEEVLMLCQLEQDEDAATDAVTLLLQLKRELQPDPLQPAESQPLGGH